MFTVSLSPKEYQRIFSKISVSPETQCWNWCGPLDQQGYGMVHYRGKTERIHRLLYAYFNGPIPRGTQKRRFAQIDHLCDNTSCCNPEHLEVVSQKTNILRGNGITAKASRQTQCKHGHPFTIPPRGGRRVCKTCDNIRHKKRLQGPQREYWLKKGRQAAQRWRDKQKQVFHSL